MPRPREVRYQGFIVTGVVIGLIAAGVLALVGTPAGDYSTGAIFGYLAVFLGLLGGLLGGGVAVLVEAILIRAGIRRSRIGDAKQAPGPGST